MKAPKGRKEGKKGKRIWLTPVKRDSPKKASYIGFRKILRQELLKGSSQSLVGNFLSQFPI